jgi:hypothetical protein
VKPGDIIDGADILGVDRKAFEGLPAPGWLRGDASPFGTDVFDCRGFALTQFSSTGDPEIAERFMQRRENTGSEYVNKLPGHSLRVEVSLEIELGSYVLKEGPLFKAEQMEDKWDIFHFGEFFYFTRSWTGDLIHVAHARERGGKLLVDDIVTTADQYDKRDGTFFVREVLFLLLNHVLGRPSPHPVPSYRAKDDESILLFSFSEFGRRGLYGTTSVSLPPGCSVT